MNEVGIYLFLLEEFSNAFNSCSEGGEYDNCYNKLSRAVNEITRTDDPTGRDYASTTHTHVKWIAAAINGTPEIPGLKQQLEGIATTLAGITERLDNLARLGIAGMAATFSGPAAVGETVHIDIHAYVFFVFAVILGVQFLWFGVLTRRIAGIHGLVPMKGRTLERGIGRFATLEYSLAPAFVGLVAGTAGCWYCFAEWQTSGFAPMQYGALLKPFILSLAALVVSVQLVATTFFAFALQEYERHKAGA